MGVETGEFPRVSLVCEAENGGRGAFIYLFVFKRFTFTCRGALSTCVYMPHVLAWCPQRVRSEPCLYVYHVYAMPNKGLGSILRWNYKQLEVIVWVLGTKLGGLCKSSECS